MDVDRMLKQLYVPPPRRQPKSRVRRAKTTAKAWVRNRSLHIAGAVLVAVAWVGIHIHYFNSLKALEFDVQVAAAQIEVQQTRRYRIQKNLTRLVSQYSAYEDKLLTTLTVIRAASEGGKGGNFRPTLGLHGAAVIGAGSAVAPASPPTSDPSASSANACVEPTEPTDPAPTPAPPAAPTPPPGTPLALGSQTPSPPIAKAPEQDLRELLSRLRVVAEQYPELQLGEPIKHLATTIVESETEIAARIMTYNEAVNNYITVTDTFPGYIFAKLSGFQPYEFYAIDKEQRKYREVSF